jgi:hypothetical protein
MDSHESGKKPLVGLCERGNETSYSIKGEKFLLLDTRLASSTEYNFWMYLVKWDRVQNSIFITRLIQYLPHHCVLSICIWTVFGLHYKLIYHHVVFAVESEPSHFSFIYLTLLCMPVTDAQFLSHNSTFTSVNKPLHCTMHWSSYKPAFFSTPS